MTEEPPPVFAGLQAMGNPESLENILGQMMKGNDIELKTEITRPMNATKLVVWAEWFDDEGMDEVGDVIRLMLNVHFKHMVSNKRKGRTELIQGVSGMIKSRNDSLAARMLGQNRPTPQEQQMGMK